MSERINRTTKVTLDPKPNTPEANKTTADDWNETWSAVNSHATDIEANQAAIGSISGGTGESFETRALAMVVPGADNDPFVVYGETGFNGQYRYLASDPNGYVNIYLYLVTTDTVTQGDTDPVTGGGLFDEFSNYVKGTKSKNLFDKSTAIDGYYVNPANGNIEPLADYAVSQYIKVSELTDYYKNTWATAAYYDVDFNFISGLSNAVYNLYPPINTVYIRISLNKVRNGNNEVEIGQLELGTTETTYESFGAKVEYNNVLGLSDELSKYMIGKGVNKNLFNRDKALLGYFTNYTTGVTSPSAGWFTSDFVSMLENEDYAKENTSIAFYDSSYVYISGIAPSQLTFTTPANTAFFKCSSIEENLDIAQIEEGSENTPYEPGYPLITKSQIKDYGKGFTFKDSYVVSKEGGDFDTISSAITFIYANFTIQETLDNPKTIILSNGTYEESIFITGGRNISLIGMNREECIIIDKTGDYYNAPVNIAGPVTLENLTIIANSDNISVPPPAILSYAVHHDFAGEGKSTIRNCTMISEQNAGIGIGTQQNQQLTIDSCDIFSANVSGLLFHNFQFTATLQALTVKNSVIKSDGVYAMAIIDTNNTTGTGDNVDTKLSFYNNVAYSSVNGKLITFTPPDSGGDFGKMILTPDSFGNNITELNK